jgi:hypothetical protein
LKWNIFDLFNRKGDRIYHQLKKLGGSFDWDRACFTMDPVCYIYSIYICRDDFFQLFSWFQHFPFKQKFWKLQDTVKMTFLKGGVDDFSYFHWFSFILYSNQNHPWLCSAIDIFLIDMKFQITLKLYNETCLKANLLGTSLCVLL